MTETWVSNRPCLNQNNIDMKQLIKTDFNACYMVSSIDDQMYNVVEYGVTTALIVETIDKTRQTLYFLDGSEMHFENTELEKVMSHVQERTDFELAWRWFEENGYHVLVDMANDTIEVNVVNLDGTDFIDVLVSPSEIEYRARLWKENNLK